MSYDAGSEQRYQMKSIDEELAYELYFTSE